jgi:hypothetical protein
MTATQQAGQPLLVDFSKLDLARLDLSPIYNQSTIVETSSAAFDPDSQMQSTSPYLGDVASTFLYVPEAPTLTIEERYLFRLAAVPVPPMGRLKILGLRTMVTIGQQTPVTADGDSWVYVQERPVETPNWAFKDGNVSWHLRVLRGPALDQRERLVLSPGQSASLYGVDASLLVGTLTPRYKAPNGGLPPGEPVGSLGTFRDQRFPWNRQAARSDLGFEVDGPAYVVLYASIWQTDPTTRIYLPAASAPADLGALVPEDRFLLAFGDGGRATTNLVRYRHVGGSIIAETGPKPKSAMTPPVAP